ncbi:MAG: cofactor-independent phosphoglycerate mutase [Candidatus Margulisiibacteriota bacterium]|nr:MAG: cofactor-independent phosphoglycerate mutase [Candidatus Margulisbacteria bacterium GWD2_39_127]OGI03949.1 MAG: cofactor-independent phosphoglycerate mutase [Candidatus Margulisbacteria bacterium GWF2_38_17]OGI08219.1 MAG: cofactor-independent phosphoglycerate mutase [Candidatus Margulisbacteria bacterium GWE2_39_32]PZM79691.1 MAG: cofactor-independent phosphoglycerate mutase [Candidatus Margulisiibacteriota bacterium]HAR61916.1 cofactor-independent phosphoglycerate mutase [Candidatus M
MKYIILLGDGMADELVNELGNKTPLEVAVTPNMDYLAQQGISGMVRTVPLGCKPGSDVANLSILGYDVKTSYTGRAPLEAASAGIELGPDDVAYRCNLVTMDNDIMEDYSAGHISTEEATELIESLNEQLGTSSIHFYTGISYRHLLVINHGPTDIETTAPHDLTGEVATGDGPEGPGSEILVELMEKSAKIFHDHPVNKKRIQEGKKPATIIWLWGQGKNLRLENFSNKYGKTGAIITAVDLLKGIGKLIGFDTPEVPGATGYLDTNYEQKVAYAAKELESKDLVYVHIEAPDEAGHQGTVNLKIKAIEDFDKHVVGPMIEIAKQYSNFKILLLPDHGTPVKTKTHSPHPVPFTIYSSEATQSDAIKAFNEIEIVRSTLKIENPEELMDLLFS